MQLSASAPASVDLPLEGVEHGRIQLEIKLQDAVDTMLVKEESDCDEVRDFQKMSLWLDLNPFVLLPTSPLRCTRTTRMKAAEL